MRRLDPDDDTRYLYLNKPSHLDPIDSYSILTLLALSTFQTLSTGKQRIVY